MFSSMAGDAGEEAVEPSVRAFRVVVAAVVVALAAVAGVTVLVDPGAGSTPPRDRVAEAEATAATWLQAWASGDRAVLRRLVDRPTAALTQALDGFDALGRPEVRATAGAPVVTGATASVPYDAEITLPSLGVWRYAGSIPLVDGDVTVDAKAKAHEHRWQVAFAPAVLQPDLLPGDRLALRLTWPERAVLQSDDGTPLPAGHPLGAIVGTMGRASAADAKRLGAPYRQGDYIGQSGLQASFEKALAGTPAADIQVVRGGKVVKVEASFAAVPGKPLRTTINLAAQSAAEAALGTEGNGAAMVVIRPSTGGILAVVSRPPTGFPRALLGRYPPGSTFKVITTLALLEKGVTLDTRVSCPKEITVNGRTIANAENEELGEITLRDAFAHSCNTAFIQLAQRLTPDELLAAANQLGFNRDLSAGTAVGRSEVQKPNGVIDLVSTAIGQGRTLTTPLQLASVAASVAAGGYRTPHFVDQMDNVGLQPLPDGTAGTLQALMRLVVTTGTGKKAAVPGTPVAGKTGTAEFGSVPPLHTHAWFLSFRGDLASSVLVEDTGFGGDFAAPIAASFYERYP